MRGQIGRGHRTPHALGVKLMKVWYSQGHACHASCHHASLPRLALAPSPYYRDQVYHACHVIRCVTSNYINVTKHSSSPLVADVRVNNILRLCAVHKIGAGYQVGQNVITCRVEYCTRCCMESPAQFDLWWLPS